MNTQLRNIKRLLAEESIPANQIAIESGLTRAAIGKLRNGEQSLEDAKLSTILALGKVAEKMIKERKLNHFESDTFVYSEEDYAKAYKRVYSDAERLFYEQVSVTIVHNGQGTFDVVVELSTPSKHDFQGWKSMNVPKITKMTSEDFEEFSLKNKLDVNLVFDVFEQAWKYFQNADIKNAKDSVEKNKKWLIHMRKNNYQGFSLDDLK